MISLFIARSLYPGVYSLRSNSKKVLEKGWGGDRRSPSNSFGKTGLNVIIALKEIELYFPIYKIRIYEDLLSGKEQDRLICNSS